MSQSAVRSSGLPWTRLAPLIRSTFAAVGDPRIGFPLPATEDWLLDGGDTRLMLDPVCGANKYGCYPHPDPGMLAFGSSTASSISEGGFAAADRLRQRLLVEVAKAPASVVYARETDRLRKELTELCGLNDMSGLELIFGASGTDLHLIFAQINGGTEAEPPLVIMVDPEETGRSVPAALAGRHFDSCSALGIPVAKGIPLAGGRVLDVATIPIRHPDGMPRDAAEIDAEVESLANVAHTMQRRVILVLADVSKTGMIAPTPACARLLRRQWPGSVEVLVDACQFRIAPSGMRAYLDDDFAVAVTGSKFLTGPAFAGALFLPSGAAQRMRSRMLPNALCAYSARADWPAAWKAADILYHQPNFGLLLRWEAALHELKAFRALPAEGLERFLERFAESIGQRLASDSLFEPLLTTPLERSLPSRSSGWDRIPTIFPFILYRPATANSRQPLSREETMQVYRWLQTDLRTYRGGCLAPDIAALRCQLGQPVTCGTRQGVPVSAVRICASARLAVEAVARGRTEEVIDRMLMTLDKLAQLIRCS